MPNAKFIKEVGPLKFLYRSVIRQFYKRVLKREQRMRLAGNEVFWLPVDSQFASEAFITGGDVDWGSEKLLLSLLEGKGAFLDIGANIGYYSLLAAPLCTAVYSFEPDPRAHLGLRRNISGHPKIELVPVAVGVQPGKAYFTLAHDCEVSHLSESAAEDGLQIEVEVTSVDTFIAARGLQVEAIKIDAEGHDLAVLEGGLNSLLEQKPIILMESIPGDGLFHLTNKVGYRVFAYWRHPETRKRSFAELLPATPVPGETKMLFLLPERLVSRVFAMA